MINITQGAVTKITEIIAEENDPELKLRIYVEGGGCSGMSYGFGLEKMQNEDDFVIEKDGVTVLVDAMSMQYLAEATVDYKDDIMGASFSVDNPQAQTTCGCGSSFSMSDDFYERDYSWDYDE